MKHLFSQSPRSSFFCYILLAMCCTLVQTARAQAWTPLGPNNRDEVGFGFFNPKVSFENTDSLYVSVKDDIYGVGIKKFDGNGWVLVGQPFFPNYTSSQSSMSVSLDITVDGNHNPVMVFADPAFPVSNDFKATVKRFTGGSWVTVGNAGFTPTATKGLSVVAVGPDTVYVLFTDPNNGNKGTVMMFDGSVWTVAGNTPITSGEMIGGVLKVNSAGVPFVAFEDAANLSKAVVLKLVGTTWQPVGPVGGVSVLDAHNISLAFDDNDNPVISYLDGAYSGISAMKFNGTAWSFLGTAGSLGYGWSSLAVSSAGVPYLFTQILPSICIVRKFAGGNWVTINTVVDSAGNAQNSGIRLVQDSIPVVAYTAYQYDNKSVVKSYNGTDWSRVGVYGVSGGGAQNIAVEIGSGNIPYVAYTDRDRNDRLSVRRWLGGSWQSVGLPAVSVDKVENISVAQGKNDTLFVACRTGTLFIPKLYRFDGNNWSDLSASPNAIHPNGVAILRLAVDTSGIPYVAFNDAGFTNKAVVKKFEGGTWVTLGVTASVSTTTDMDLQIGKDNTPYLVYYGNSQTQLVKYVGIGWQSAAPAFTGGQSLVLQLDSADVPYICYRHYGGSPSSQTQSPGLVRLVGGAWVNVGAAFISSSSTSSIMQCSFVLSKSGIPYVGARVSTLSTIRGFDGSNWVTLNTSPNGWDPAIRTYSFSMAADNSGSLLAAYTNGGGYVMALDTSSQPAPPLVSSPLYYCQNDTAVALTASGQNLLWYTSLSGTGSPNAPVPSTATPGVFTWYVSQTVGLWESDKDSVIVTVHPSPVPTVTHTGAYLQASGPYSSYQWFLNSAPLAGATADTLTPLVSGSYSVLAVDSNGCSGMSAAVSPPPPPTVSGPLVYCMNTSANPLTAVGQNLLWYTSLSGTGSSVAPVPSTATPGLFTWYVSQTVGLWESDKDSVVIAVFPLPTPVIVNNGSYLQVTGPYLSYQWFLNGIAIAGATTDTLLPLQSGSYTVWVSDSNGCSDTSAASVVTAIENILHDDIVAYPNPATDRVVVRGSSQLTLSVQTLDGRTLKTGKGPAVIISDLAPGIYMLQIHNDKGRLLKRQKIVKL